MSSSLIHSNLALNAAYHHFQQGELDLALQHYHKALKNTFPQDLKLNIKCTIAVIEQSMGRYDDSIKLLSSQAIPPNHSNNSIVMLRVYTNLTLMQIFEGRFTKSLEYFERIMEIIEKQKSIGYKHQLLKFSTYLFFRVSNLQQIGQQIQNMDFEGMRVEEVYTMSLMAFNSEICKLQSQQKIQKKCYEQFMKNHRYDLALLSLRSLIHFSRDRNLVNKQFYQKELAKLVMMGYFSEQIDFDNYQPYEVIQAIMEQFIIFTHQLRQQILKKQMEGSQMLNSKQSPTTDSQQLLSWKYALSTIKKELHKTKDIQHNSKHQISQMLENIQTQTNLLVIRSMIKNSYFLKYYERTHHAIKIIPQVLLSKIKNIQKHFFGLLKGYMSILQSSNRMQKSIISSVEEFKKEGSKKDRTKSFTKIKEDKQNCIPSGISIVSVASSKVSKESTRRKIFGEDHVQSSHKKMLKMVRLCEHGSFLNKRNFNSEGGEFKFVKINNSFIKWGKDPQKIEANCQIYPLKDIRSIVYGRVTPNLNESCNKMLNYSNCFSLLLQKRTLDFYCRNYQELEAWVCGITHVLKKEGTKIVGYTPGKLRWKKMFAILKQNFIEPLKHTEKNKYYYQNAYALKLFAKNGYQLPAKHREKK